MADYQHILPLDEPGPITRVTFLNGRFDGNAVRELFELSNDLPASHPKLLVDCTQVALVPSGAMGMLLTIRKRFLGHGGQLHLAVPDENVRRSFAAAHLDRLLLIFDSVESAKSAFKR